MKNYDWQIDELEIMAALIAAQHGEKAAQAFLSNEYSQLQIREAKANGAEPNEKGLVVS